MRPLSRPNVDYDTENKLDISIFDGPAYKTFDYPLFFDYDRKIKTPSNTTKLDYRAALPQDGLDLDTSFITLKKPNDISINVAQLRRDIHTPCAAGNRN